jgi:acyl carrier protein
MGRRCRIKPGELTRDGIAVVLREFILTQNSLEDGSILEEDTNLFEAGLLDSLLTASLVVFCEANFQCRLELSELTDNNLQSIAALSRLISRILEPSA